MQHYTTIKDVENLDHLLKEALEIKKSPFKYKAFGANKTLGLLFFNPSLRTRLSTQRAAQNLGMDVIVLNVNGDSWKLETQDGVIMDGDKAEHIREAAPVIAQYCDIIGVRSFAGFESKEDDYNEKILMQFVEYCGVPIVSLEAATRHPLQSLADLITIEEFKTVERPKVVLTWAPHPRALPQAVSNSFVEFASAANVDLVVTHPEGYELAPEFMNGITPEYDQMKAFEGADFIYAKNWASYNDYGKVLSTDRSWTVSNRQMAVTNNAKFMHCLPVRRNMVVADEVIDSPNSVVIQEAANRTVAAQVVLKKLLEGIE